MASITFKNLTKEQAETFAEWYSGQGEQDADYWFDANCEDPRPRIDYSETSFEADKNGDVTVICK